MKDRENKSKHFQLPQAFQDKMKEILGSQYDEYIKSYTLDKYSGLRINTWKISLEEFEEMAPCKLEKIQWIKNGYYYDNLEQPAKHPYYYAGLYYIQEPSAMTPASMLPVCEGDKILDLCAAPGGKTTELGARLKGTGILVCNDISNSRAKALQKNVELFGITNALVTSEEPDKLLDYFEGYFDKILVDAPCSGEGMFRKDISMIKNWSEGVVSKYSSIQRNILTTAAKMLKPDGYLLYSTCTFSPEENEGSIMHLLKEFPEFSIEEVPIYEGFDTGKPHLVEDGIKDLEKCIRLWPHQIKGEGHFIALLKKNKRERDSSGCKQFPQYTPKNKTHIKEVREFLQEYVVSDNIFHNKILEEIDGRVYLIPDILPETKGLRILLSGWNIGQVKNGRFEPSTSLALGIKSHNFQNIINFDKHSYNVIKYLKGDTIEIDNIKEKGWVLVCVDGFPLGFGKASDGFVKNKYNTSWRMN